MRSKLPAARFISLQARLLGGTVVVLLFVMATDADIEKAAADKRIADEANASAAAANWPTGGYTFIPLLITCMFAVLAICVDVSTICLVHDFIIQFQYVITTVYVMFMIYYWMNLIKQLLKYSTIQKT